MNSRKSYRAVVERDGGWWFIQLPDIGRATQARRLDRVEAMVRDLVALVEGVAEDSFDIEVALNLEPDVSRAVTTAVAAKGRATAAQAEASNELRRVAHSLAASDYTLRDVGAMLGVTHQRIAQLLAASDNVYPIATPQTSVANKRVRVQGTGHKLARPRAAR